MDERIDHIILKLSCPRFNCLIKTSGKTIDVLIKDYEPGKLKCSLCGTPLTTLEEDRIDHQLIALGVKDINS